MHVEPARVAQRIIRVRSLIPQSLNKKMHRAHQQNVWHSRDSSVRPGSRGVSLLDFLNEKPVLIIFYLSRAAVRGGYASVSVGARSSVSLSRYYILHAVCDIKNDGDDDDDDTGDCDTTRCVHFEHTRNIILWTVVLVLNVIRCVMDGFDGTRCCSLCCSKDCWGWWCLSTFCQRHQLLANKKNCQRITITLMGLKSLVDCIFFSFVILKKKEKILEFVLIYASSTYAYRLLANLCSPLCCLGHRLYVWAWEKRHRILSIAWVRVLSD